MISSQPIFENLNSSSAEKGACRSSSGGIRAMGRFKKHSIPGKPLVSVITVVLNAVRYIEETIQSVLGQSYENLEYIVVDGGSTDGTLDIIKKYAGKIDYWVSERDSGIYDAMNKGIGLATGEIVGLLNAGDCYVTGTVQKAVECLRSERADIFFGKKIVWDDDLMLTRDIDICLPISLKNVHLNQVHPTVFVNRRVYEEFLFNSYYRIAADLDFFFRAFKAGAKFCKSDKRIAAMRTGGASDNLLRPLEEGFMIYRKHLGLKAALSFALRHLVTCTLKIMISKCFTKSFQRKAKICLLNYKPNHLGRPV